MYFLCTLQDPNTVPRVQYCTHFSLGTPVEHVIHVCNLHDPPVKSEFSSHRPQFAVICDTLCGDGLLKAEISNFRHFAFVFSSAIVESSFRCFPSAAPCQRPSGVRSPRAPAPYSSHHAATRTTVSPHSTSTRTPLQPRKSWYISAALTLSLASSHAIHH